MRVYQNTLLEHSLCFASILMLFVFQLPLFLCLCKDEVWGVRKACADVFTDVSYASLPQTRREKLTPAFLQLLNDPSRWVKP